MCPIKHNNEAVEPKRSRRKFSEFRSVEKKQIERSTENVSARQAHVAAKKPTNDSLPLQAKHQQEWCMKKIVISGHFPTDLISLKRALIDVYAGEIRRLFLPNQPKTALAAAANENSLYVRSLYIPNAAHLRSPEVNYDLSGCDISDFVGSCLLNILLAEGDNKPDNALVGEDGKLKFPDNDGGFAELVYQDYDFGSGVPEIHTKKNHAHGINYGFNEIDLANVPNLPDIPTWKYGVDLSPLFVEETPSKKGVFAPDRWFLDNTKQDNVKDKSRSDTLDRLNVTEQQKMDMEKQRFKMLFQIAIVPNKLLKDIFLNAVTYDQIAYLESGTHISEKEPLKQLMSEKQFKQFRDGLISYLTVRRQDFIKSAFKVPGFKEFFIKEMNNAEPNSLLDTTAQQLENLSGKKPHKNTSLYFVNNTPQDFKEILKEEAHSSYLYYGRNDFDQLYSNAVKHFKDTINNLDFWRFFQKRRLLADLNKLQANISEKKDWTAHQKTLYLTFMMTLHLSGASLSRNYFSDLTHQFSTQTRMAGPTKAVIEQARKIGLDANYKKIILENPGIIEVVFSKAFASKNLMEELLRLSSQRNEGSLKILPAQLELSKTIRTELGLFGPLYAYQASHPQDLVFDRILKELPTLTEDEQKYLLFNAYLASHMYDAKSVVTKTIETYLVNYLEAKGHLVNNEISNYDNLLLKAPIFITTGSQENRRSLVTTFYQIFKAQDILLGGLRNVLSRFFSRWIYPFETREKALDKTFVLIRSVVKHPTNRLADIEIPKNENPSAMNEVSMSAAAYAIDMYSYRRPHKYNKSLRQIELILDSFNDLKASPKEKDEHRQYFLWVVYQASYKLEKNSLFTRHLQRILGTLVSEPEKFRAMSLSERHSYLSKQFNAKEYLQENMLETIAKISLLLKQELHFLKFGLQADNEMKEMQSNPNAIRNDWEGVKTRVLKRDEDTVIQFKNIEAEYNNYIFKDNELRENVVKEIFNRDIAKEWSKKVSTIKLQGLIYENLDKIPTTTLESYFNDKENQEKFIDDFITDLEVEVNKHVSFIEAMANVLEKTLLDYIDQVRSEAQEREKAELSENKIQSIKLSVQKSISGKNFPKVLDLFNDKHSQLTEYKADLKNEIKLALRLEQTLLLYIDKKCSEVENEQQVKISEDGIVTVKENVKKILSEKSLPELIAFSNNNEGQLSKFEAEIEKEIRLAPFENAGISYRMSLKS